MVILFLLFGTLMLPAAQAQSACALLPKVDVEIATGMRAAAGEDRSEGGAATCDYKVGRGLVTVSAERSTAKIDLAAQVRAVQAELDGARFRPLEGLTVPAFLLEIPDAGVQIHMLNGERDYLMVSVLGLSEAQSLAQRLARCAVELRAASMLRSAK